MRGLKTILLCAVLAIGLAEPEPKKYKPDERKTNMTSLTEDERTFLREVEKKFGIKSDIPIEKKKDENKTEINPTKIRLPFPAVVAIEIVNDTETKTKGKRTIDANLGYGYQTNHGYTYTYFGKPEEKGKFMVYPYSQEDIPPPSYQNNAYRNKSPTSNHHESASLVDIQPSRAYELVQVKDEGNGYEYKKPAVEFKSKYENVQGVESPPPPYPAHGRHESSQTLYTTYNGESFSGLQGQFPSVSSNYLVDASQLAQYQGGASTYDHSVDHQRVVPVLVLRIPSSSLKDPSAELYADTQNHQLSQYLDSANLQELVNEYFKKLGYNAGPQVQTVNSPLTSNTHEVTQQVGHGQYADPYVTPSYSHSDYSGIQYSAVQPTMAKYPAQNYPQYHQVYEEQEQKIQYHYDPQTGQMYYLDYQSTYPAAGQEYQYSSQPAQHHAISSSHIEYGTPNEAPSHSVSAPNTKYSAPVASESIQSPVDYSAKKHKSSKQSGRPRYSSKITYSSTPTQKESVAVYPSYTSQNIEGYRTHPQSESLSSYYYQKGENDEKGLVLTENYPSKDHTHATALSYDQTPKKSKPVQSINYVTPVPYSLSKYQADYNVMVPQMVLNNDEKVTYVTSQSYPAQSYLYSNSKPAVEYTVPTSYLPPIGSQKPPSYPRNYHSSAKRNTNRSHLKSTRKEKREDSQSETA